MADYRLECCGGFPTHRESCYASKQYQIVDRQRHEDQINEYLAWDMFFDGLSDEDIFRYIEACDNEVKRVERFRRRSEMAKRYLREKGRITKYLDWTRR